MADFKLKDIIIPAFYDVHKDIKERKHTHYWFKGGRGSTKSSFISIEIVYNIIRDPECNAICFRKVGKDIEESVYNQILWAIDILGVQDYFKALKSPYRIIYIPTGQVIAFRGLDDATKTKSIKLKKGYYKMSWFEELDEFTGPEEIRKAEQSVMRGGDTFLAFKSYNPPQNINNWVNQEVLNERPDRLVHHSTYLQVPPEWLGHQFIIEATHLKSVNEIAYRHEYMGEVTGTGLTVFPNVEIREITDDEIKQFDNIKQGIDWGYAADPFVFLKLHYSQTFKKLYFFDEIYEHGLLNSDAISRVFEKYSPYSKIFADSEDPKSIREFWDAGLDIRGAKKGPGSRGFGFRFLQAMESIVIDPERCPNAAREFMNAEFEKEKDGSIRNEYPGKDDHTIDAARYALERDMPNAMKVR